MDFGGNVTDSGLHLKMLSEMSSEGMLSLLTAVVYQPWFASLIGSVLIGLSGIFPLLVIPIEEGANLKTGGGARTLNVLLSFAVGCLLGDVFLHLLPEVWSDGDEHGPVAMQKGLWVLTGLLLFIILEKAFSVSPGDGSEPSKPPRCCKYKSYNNNIAKELHKLSANGDLGRPAQTNGIVPGPPPGCAWVPQNGGAPCVGVENCRAGSAGDIEDEPKGLVKPAAGQPSIHVSGYLNLMANSFDNFTHGLAVGGSFLISFPHGVLTTTAILLHEIPHEVGDFAILLRSGFSRWDAARAQLLTSSAGMMGAMTAVLLGGVSTGVEARTSWILPFTAGGFLHIALVTVLPDLLKEEKPAESLLQLTALLAGVAVMAAMASMTE